MKAILKIAVKKKWVKEIKKTDMETVQIHLNEHFNSLCATSLRKDVIFDGEEEKKDFS